VIPARHITKPIELTEEEAREVMLELGRLSLLLDNGFGTGIMQKYQPLQVQNHVKVDHLHFHVFPRKEHETGLFPVPEPNRFDGYFIPSDMEIINLIHKLK
jgi:diadenosine tetraphosphate (Ap4A) HIT family hydrolase